MLQHFGLQARSQPLDEAVALGQAQGDVFADLTGDGTVDETDTGLLGAMIVDEIDPITLRVASLRYGFFNQKVEYTSDTFGDEGGEQFCSAYDALSRRVACAGVGSTRGARPRSVAR